MQCRHEFHAFLCFRTCPFYELIRPSQDNMLGNALEEVSSQPRGKTIATLKSGLEVEDDEVDVDAATNESNFRFFETTKETNDDTSSCGSFKVNMVTLVWRGAMPS